MAQSTEDYLDSLLRQAMGIPEPEPEKKPEEDTSELARDDVFAMAEGLTGSNSAILGNVYDHNASFTNEGEIETAPIAPEVQAQEPAVEVPVIPPEELPDPDAPPVIGVAESSVIPEFTENLLPEVEIPEAVPEQDLSAEAPVMTDPGIGMDLQSIPDGPVVEHDGSLDIIPEPVIEHANINDALDGTMPEPVVEIPTVEQPVMEQPVVEEPVMEQPVIEQPTIEEPVITEPVMEEPVIETPVVEQPIIEQPVIEQPTIEEPVVTEPVMEEPIIEEPAAEEAAPALSIDDLDPNDSTKALDADTIAALFAGADAEEAPAEEMPSEQPAVEEPVIEEPIIEEPVIAESVIEEPVIAEPVIEEPAIEEPVTEEPVIEETAMEEPAAEEAAPTLSIDDLDPNDSTKALDADTIAALFAGANADETPEEEPAEEEPVIEEPAIEEPASEEIDGLEGGDDAQLEEIEISDDDSESEPLMPDQEITDLLSSLDDITGEGSEEESGDQESPAGEPSGEETASEEGIASDVDLGGIDVFDTDLSAMLDDVTTNIDLGSLGESDAEAGDSTDLGDLLGSMDDGSGDLSDIGDLLEKDENSELVDPNTETAEALFASDSEEELFNIDNLIDEEEEASGKKKKKKGFFKKKKKKSDNIEVIGGDEEMLIDPDLLDIPDESELKKKKKGFFANLFAKLFEEVGEDGEGENELIGLEQTAVEIAQEGAAENEQILTEMEEEDSGKKKKEKKKKEKKEKKGKKGGDSEGEEGEEAADDSKKKKKEKKEKKKKEKLPELPGKRLPRKKVVAIALFCITVGIVIIFLAFLYPYSQDMKKAKKFYTTGEYQKTYEYMRGHKLTEEDKLLYERTVTLLRIKRPYDSYQNYMKMGLRMEALNALVQGVQMSDKYAEAAASLGVTDKYSKLSRTIYDELYNSFGVTVDKARSWLALEGTPEYTRALYECLIDTAGSRNVDDEPLTDYVPDEDSVINSEEKDL